MGTSQSFSLKTTPNWTEAKRAMTALTKPEGRTQSNFNRYLGSFSRAVSSDGGRIFGQAGARTSTKFVSLIGDIREHGLQQVVERLQAGINFQDLSSKDILLVLYKNIVGQDDANIDDAAAKAAMDMVLTKIFSDCETPAEIDTIVHDATTDQIDGWILEFYVDYFMEFNAELFQTHIFEKEADPDNVCGNIKDFTAAWFQENVKEEIGRIDIFSEDGKRYLKGLTDKILSIWAQK